jgi:hypothetical protein
MGKGSVGSRGCLASAMPGLWPHPMSKVNEPIAFIVYTMGRQNAEGPGACSLGRAWAGRTAVGGTNSVENLND